MRVENGGPYDVRFRLSEEGQAAASTARLAVGETTYQEPLREGAGGVTFEGVELPRGNVRLDAALTQGEETRGPHQVVLTLREE